MIKIYTKYDQRSGAGFTCFGTIKGYDYSFSGTNKIQVQSEMNQQLKKLKVAMEDVIYETPFIVGQFI